MNTDVEDPELAERLQAAAPAASGRLDHRMLQRTGRRRRALRRSSMTVGAVVGAAALIVAVPAVLPDSPPRSVGVTDPEGGGCPPSIVDAWACVEEDRPVAPEPDLAVVDGVGTAHAEPIRLAETRGRVVVISMVAGWCAPCVSQQTALNTVEDEQRGDVVFLAVSVLSSIDLSRQFAQEAQVGHPMLLDPDATYLTRLHQALGTDEWNEENPVIPQTFVLDPSGRIAARTSGRASVEGLGAAISYASGTG